jgi:heme-degrading monooxygenase HmoA
MQTLTHIVPFEIPEGQETIFSRQWHDVTEPLSHKSGFLSARLYEISSEVEDYVRHNIHGMKWLDERRFRFINIAEWVSLTHYEAAIRSVEAKTILFPSYPAYYHLDVGFGETAESYSPHESSAGQEFTFIVPFEVPEGQEEEMCKQFQAVVEGMEHQEGAWGPGLYGMDIQAEKRLQSFFNQPESGSVRSPFRFINVAEWASVEHYKAAMRSRHHIKPISFVGHGSYYRIATEYIGHNA